MTNIVIYLKSNNALTGPPLSTLFSQYEINTSLFCSKFNELTRELNPLIIWKVNFVLKRNKNFEIFLNKPPISFLLNCLIFYNSVNNKFLDVNLIVKLVIFKYGVNNIHSSLKSVFGTLNSMGLVIKIFKV